MIKNKYLKVTVYLVRLMQLIYGLMIILFVYLIMVPIFDWSLPSLIQGESNQFFFIEINDLKSISKNPFNLTFFSIQAIFLIVLFELSLESIIKIINSIKKISAFKKDTINHFIRIAFMMLAAFLISLFEVKLNELGYSVQISLQLQYLLFAGISFILAEIFKEGNKLWEENQLTV